MDGVEEIESRIKGFEQLIPQDSFWQRFDVQELGEGRGIHLDSMVREVDELPVIELVVHHPPIRSHNEPIDFLLRVSVRDEEGNIERGMGPHEMLIDGEGLTVQDLFLII